MPHKCPIAQKTWRNGYMKRRREKLGDHLRAQERARAAAVQQFIRDHKLKCGCADCGYSAHHVALEFDHLVDKELNVCNAKSIAQAKLEIAKCEVVCANCHRIRTFDRLQERHPRTSSRPPTSRPDQRTNRETGG